MKRPLSVAVTIIILVLAWSLKSTAQEPASEPEPPSFAAIEAYMCNWNDRKDIDDLMKVVDKWNAWADGVDFAPYNAWVMTPILKSVNMPLDVVWLGAWENGVEMGKGFQTWLDGGDALQKEFDKVISCYQHSNIASVNLREPKHQWPGETGIAAFSNCTLAEGKNMSDAMAANAAWVQYLDKVGSQAGLWAFFTGAGANNPEWDYTMVASHPDFNSYGHDFEAFTNGQGWAAAGKIYGGVVSCDSPRVYHSRLVRNGGVSPD